jgi:hypothetical protein
MPISAEALEGPAQMLKVVKALLLFALMLAIPIAADNLLRARPEVPLTRLPLVQWFGGIPQGAILLLLALPALWFAINFYVKEQDRLSDIQSCLKRAERDLNALLRSGVDHTGRKNTAIERSEWNVMTVSSAPQTFNAGYRTPAHDLIDLNERDLASKGATMGKASATAMLFRELYEGSIGTARSRIVADVKNGGNPPYVAPGISELIGFGSFDKASGSFEKEAKYTDDDLELAVKLGGFPTDDLIMVKTNAAGEKTVLRGYQVLFDLTQQNV